MTKKYLPIDVFNESYSRSKIMIGSGGQGKIYQSNDKLFAIKCFPTILFDDPNCFYSVDWFMNEIACNAKLFFDNKSHPNILGITAWSFDKDFLLYCNAKRYRNRGCISTKFNHN